MTIKANIFNIQHFSLHDGPGIRTTVFFKGCNLRCAWCHNPESWTKEPVLEFNSEKCIGCGECFKTCCNLVHNMNAGVHELDRSRCTVCGRCADKCYAGAISISGQKISCETLFSAIVKDKAYYDNSGGGVTFSGGECMLQIDFLEETLKKSKESGIHTAVDTAGHVPFDAFLRIIPYTDLFLFDIKASDSKVSKDLTLANGELIWSNLIKLLESGANVIVRIPCVLGANWDDLPSIADRLKNLPVKVIELLPYHRLGEGKFNLLGLECKKFSVPTKGQMESISTLFQKDGRVVVVND